MECFASHEIEEITPATEVGDNDTEASTIVSKKRKLTSTVWAEFDKTSDKDGKISAICKYCKKHYCGDSSNGTTHLRNHLKRCARRNVSSQGQKQLQLETTQSSEIAPKVWKFDLEKCRRSFSIAVAMHNYSFKMCEHFYFKHFLNDLQPMFKMVSRTTLHSDIINIYQNEKQKLYKLLEDQQCRVSLTTDLWTAEHQNITYICVTCHYINNEWKLQKKILAYRRFDFPHDSESLYSRILDIILEWNIDKRITSLVVDNASNNDGMVKTLKSFLSAKQLLLLNGDLFHVRCSAHILNLVVQDGLKNIAGMIENIRSSVKYLHRSTYAKQKFDIVLRQVRLESKQKIPLDVPHRWN